MATTRDMINANEVLTKLATKTNLNVKTSFALLPLLDFVTTQVETYFNKREEILAMNIPMNEKEVALSVFLDKEIVLLDLDIPVIQLKGCDLTLIDIQHMRWWLVESSSESSEEWYG